MLTGIAIGIIISLLVFVIIFLLGMVRAQRQIAMQYEAKLAAGDAQVRSLAAHAQRMSQPMHFTDEQVVQFSNSMLRGVERLWQAENNKLN
jgi:hypothetical protein